MASFHGLPVQLAAGDQAGDNLAECIVIMYQVDVVSDLCPKRYRNMQAIVCRNMPRQVYTELMSSCILNFFFPANFLVLLLHIVARNRVCRPPDGSFNISSVLAI